MMMSGLKSLDQLHLLLGLPARHRDHGAAQPLGAVVRAQAAGEQAVAVGDVHDVAGAPAGGADRARDQVGPGVDVALRVAHDGRLAGRARRGVDAHDLLARHREHAERVVVAQVLLGRERELAPGRRATCRSAGCTPRASNARAVVRHVVVGVLQASTAGAAAAAPAARRGWRSRSARGRRGGVLDGHRVVSFSACVPVADGQAIDAACPSCVYERPRNTATRSPRWLVTSMS